MENTVKERLKMFLKQRNIKAVDFCSAINVSNGFISGMRKSMQPDKVKRISLKYPELNIDWLITGEGDMLKSGDSNVIGDKNTINTSGDGSVLNTGKISGESIFIDTGGKERNLKKRIKELEEEVQRLRVDKTHLQDLVSLLKKNKDDS